MHLEEHSKNEAKFKQLMRKLGYKYQTYKNKNAGVGPNESPGGFGMGQDTPFSRLASTGPSPLVKGI